MTPRLPRKEATIPLGPPPPSDATDLTGSVLAGRYELVRRISCGGMSEVYEAVARASGQRVALKLLLPHVSALPDSNARFHQEFRLLASLTSESIVRAFDFDRCADGRPFFTMELLDGCDLEVVLQRDGPLAVDAVIEVGVRVCDALEILHARGILHRDIKPSNLFLVGPQDDLVVKIIDLGIAKSMSASSALTFIRRDRDEAVTSPGLVVGTPGYLAPESRTQGPTLAQEIYALGAALYKLAVGHLPASASAEALEAALVQAGASTAQARVLLTAIAADPNDRYSNIAGFKMALQHARREVSGSVTDAALSAMGSAIGTDSRPLTWIMMLCALFFGVVAWMSLRAEGFPWPALEGVQASAAAAWGPRPEARAAASEVGPAGVEASSVQEDLSVEAPPVVSIHKPPHAGPSGVDARAEPARRPNPSRRLRTRVPAVLRPAQAVLRQCFTGLAKGTDVPLVVYFSATGKMVDAWIPAAPPSLDACVDAALEGFTIRPRGAAPTTVKARFVV